MFDFKLKKLKKNLNALHMVCIFLRKSTIFKYIFLKKLENNIFKQTMKTFLVCLLLVQLFVACTIAQTNIPSLQTDVIVIRVIRESGVR